MAETRHDNTKSTHCRDVGALSLEPGLEPTHRQGMQRSYDTYSSRTWPFCQSNCTLVSPGHRNDKSHLFLPNYRRKQRSFVGVNLRAVMFSFPSCIALDNSGRLFHDLSRYHAGHQHVPFKHSVLNTSCHVIDKDVAPESRDHPFPSAAELHDQADHSNPRLPGT